MEYANCTCDIEPVAGEGNQYIAYVVYPSYISITRGHGWKLFGILCLKESTWASFICCHKAKSMSIISGKFFFSISLAKGLILSLSHKPLNHNFNKKSWWIQGSIFIWKDWILSHHKWQIYITISIFMSSSYSDSIWKCL